MRTATRVVRKTQTGATKGEGKRSAEPELLCTKVHPVSSVSILGGSETERGQKAI